MTFSDSWPADHSEALKALVLEKFGSFAEIAGELNFRLKTNYSRNACIGRAKRMGLPSVNPAPPKTKARRERSNVVQLHPTPKVTSPPLNERAELWMRCVEIVPLKIELMDLQPSQCRWPYGEGPFVFCGHPPTLGSSYCMPHFALSLGIGTESERNADRVLEKLG